MHTPTENSINTDALNNIEETLLIPLWARAKETIRDRDALLKDPLATTILDALDYDCSAFSNAKLSQLGCSVRCVIFDNEVTSFLQKYPRGTVINVGCGLDTRAHRLSHLIKGRWYDVDLPEVIALRRHFMPETEHIKYLDKSFMDPDLWDLITPIPNEPIAVVAEGVFMYFTEEQIRAFLTNVLDHGAGAKVHCLIESTPRIFSNQDTSKHDALGKMKKTPPKYLWGTSLHAKEVNRWFDSLNVVRVHNFTDYARKRWGIARFLGLRFFNNKIIVLTNLEDPIK